MSSDFVPINLRRALESRGIDADAVWSVLTSDDGIEFADIVMRAQPHHGDKPLLVGEAPGPRGNPSYPLFPLPARCAGGRLAAAFGLSTRDYIRCFRRVDLLDYYPGVRWRKADMERAQAAAACIKTMTRDLGLVILCGANVAAAWGHDAPEFDVVTSNGLRRIGYRVVRIPHPSGRNRAWSNPEMVRKLRGMIIAEEPWIAARFDR